MSSEDASIKRMDASLTRIEQYLARRERELLEAIHAAAAEVVEEAGRAALGEVMTRRDLRRMVKSQLLEAGDRADRRTVNRHVKTLERARAVWLSGR